MESGFDVTQSKLFARPFGMAPALLGLRAYDALYDLCDVAEWSEARRGYWVPSDKRSFQGWFNVEEAIAPAQAEPTINIDQVDDMNELLFQYHAALPFDEAEREWLHEAYAEAWGSDSIGIIRRQEAGVVSGGLHRVIYGRDLMRRWWAWRRGTDQFAGQGTVDLAREALRALIETTHPDMGLPETYLALRNVDG
jgi:hypothetical protein